MTERRFPLPPARSGKQRLARALLEKLGWQIDIAPFPGPRGILIVYPHTSNWDFVIGMLAKWASGIDVSWLGKEALFQGVLGKLISPLLRSWGGEPVERGTATGAIPRLAQRFYARDWYWLAFSPEGTRRFRPTWRSGFYHLAIAAKVPLGLVYLDFSKKQVGVIDYLELSGDMAVDMAAIAKAYEGRIGLRPELAAPIVLEKRSP